MGIRIVLALLCVVGIAIAWCAQFGESILLGTTSYLQQALEAQGLDANEERLLDMLWTHMRFWSAVLWFGIAVFALACVGFWVSPKARRVHEVKLHGE